MATEIKPVVAMADTFDRLDIRVGRILSVAPAEQAAKPSCVLKADFGRFGVKTSVARLSTHPPDELTGLLVLGVLNLGTREVGGVASEFLCLGVQRPGTDSGEATPITPLGDAKLGSKLF